MKSSYYGVILEQASLSWSSLVLLGKESKMICYKGQTFCSAKCLRTTCPRNFTDEVQQAAREWWSHDPDNAPVAFLDFSSKCPDYQPVKGK